MDIKQTQDGKFIACYFVPTKQRFRTDMTKDGNPVEATDFNDLQGVKKYGSIESLARALRKRKAKKK